MSFVPPVLPSSATGTEATMVRASKVMSLDLRTRGPVQTYIAQPRHDAYLHKSVARQSMNASDSHKVSNEPRMRRLGLYKRSERDTEDLEQVFGCPTAYLCKYKHRI